MKQLISYVGIVALLLTGAELGAQTAESTSGVVKLNMKKDPVPAKGNTQTPANEYSQATSIRMSKQKPASLVSSETVGFSWISPAFTSIQTSESVYPISATVTSEENIRFLNLYVNDRYIKTIKPPVSTLKQMVIEEEVDLSLGANHLRVEAITVSGKKLESRLEIVYNISAAKYFALIIAVQQYDDPNIYDLDFPVRDARRFRDVLESDYSFPTENINFLENPSKADIIGTLHHMRDQITNEDNLLIFYAGHGHYDEEMETGYWLPRDARRDNPVNWLPNTDLTNYLNVLKTKHTLLIADACFSGGIFKSRAAFNNVLAVEQLYKLNSRKALTSGALSEVPDESEFIKYLIRRLNQNTKKYLPSEQLYSSLKGAVMDNSNTVPQYGTIQNVGDEGGDFIFIRND